MVTCWRRYAKSTLGRALVSAETLVGGLRQTADQAKVGLVQESGGLQEVAGALFGAKVGGNVVQFRLQENED